MPCATDPAHGPVIARGLCSTCYSRWRRGSTATRLPDGEGGRITVRLSTELRAEMERLAKADGVGVTTWARTALEAAALRATTKRP